MNYTFKLVFCMTIFVTAAYAMEEQEYSIARRKYNEQDLSVMKEKNRKYHARRRNQQRIALASGANKENHGDCHLDDLPEGGVNIDLINSAILAARTNSKK